MKKLLSLLLATLMLASLAACGAGESSSVSSEAPVIRPASSQPVTSELDEEAAREAELAAIRANSAMLTGLPKGEDYPEGQRVVGIMINNIASSRPTRGLTEAKVLYEIQVEGGITRFMGVFEDYKNLPTIGGIRSARDQFFQMLLPLWGFYVHDGPGGESPVNTMMRTYEYSEFDLQPNSGSAFRLNRPGMPLEYTEYTSGESIVKAVENKGTSDYRSYGSPMFNFVPYTEPKRVPEGGSAKEVGIVHSQSYRTFFEYDAASGKYLMSQFNSSKGGVHPTIDENNNEQVSFDNVIVVFCGMSMYANSYLPKFHYSNGGGAFYISQGGFEPMVWQKGSPESFLKFWKIEDGAVSEESVTINPGTTYIAVVDDQYSESFYQSLLAGDTSAAEQGQVNANEVDE